MKTLLTFACLMALTFASTEAEACPDFDGDGVVSLPDYSLFVDHWNTAEARYDLNGDGSVNLPDYQILVSRWGDRVQCSEGPDDWGSARRSVSGSNFTYDAQSGHFYVVAGFSSPSKNKIVNKVFAFSSEFLRLRHLDFYLDNHRDVPVAIAAGGGRIYVVKQGAVNVVRGVYSYDPDSILVYTTRGERVPGLDFTIGTYRSLGGLFYSGGLIYATNHSYPTRVLVYSVNQRRLLRHFDPNIWVAGTPDVAFGIVHVPVNAANDLLFVVGSRNQLHVLDTSGKTRGTIGDAFTVLKNEQGYTRRGAGPAYVPRLGTFYHVWDDGSFTAKAFDIGPYLRRVPTPGNARKRTPTVSGPSRSAIA